MLRRGGYRYGDRMLTMEAVGIRRGGIVDVFRGGGKGERNGWQRYDHR